MICLQLGKWSNQTMKIKYLIPVLSITFLCSACANRAPDVTTAKTIKQNTRIDKKQCQQLQF